MEVDEKEFLTLKEVQFEAKEMLKVVVDFLEKNNFNYYIWDGTFLGAVRHKGFIPWDDDIDIGMFRDDYERFISIAVNEIDDKYFIHCSKTDEHYWLPFAKVKMNNTTFVETFMDGKESLHSGIFIDIFPFDKTGSNYMINRFKGLLIKNISDCLLVKENKIKLGEARHIVISRFFNLFSKNRLLKMQRNIINLYNKNDYYVCWIGSYHIKKELLKVSDTLPLTKVKFGKKNYKAFGRYEQYLENLYGDFMKLPPEEDRINHGVVDISFDKGSNIISKDVVK